MPSGIEVLSLREIGFEQEIEENGATLEENSRIKAETVWEYVKGTMDNGQRTMDIDGVFADDTGLEIDALTAEHEATLARIERELTRAMKAWSDTAPPGGKPSFLDDHYAVIQ